MGLGFCSTPTESEAEFGPVVRTTRRGGGGGGAALRVQVQHPECGNSSTPSDLVGSAAGRPGRPGRQRQAKRNERNLSVRLVQPLAARDLRVLTQRRAGLE